MKDCELIFTEEDKKQLIENRNKIYNWIMENIVPKINEDDRIVVDYGGTYMGMRSYETTSNYHIAVFGKRNTIYHGSEVTDGYIGIGEKYGNITRILDNNNVASDIYPVVSNWSEIKEALLLEVEKRKESKKAIYNFEV